MELQWPDSYKRGLEDYLYYEEENGLLFCGDCLEVMSAIPDESIELIVTDIPYAEVNRASSGLRNLDKGLADELRSDLHKVILQFIRVCSGSIYIFCGWEQLSPIFGLMKTVFSMRVIIWEKTNPSPMNGEHIWLSGIERVVYGKKAGAPFNASCRNTVLLYPSGDSSLHPTQKPLELFKELIQISSNPGNIVLDAFLGSGTTAVAAKELNRNYIGIELEEYYCAVSKERLRQEVLLLKNPKKCIKGATSNQLVFQF